MLSNLLLVVLIIGGAFAASWKAGIDFNAASSQVSRGTANVPLPASSTVSATRDLNKTTSRSPGSVFGSLTSMFPISLPPDTLNSTLLPPPPTLLPTSKSLLSSVLASTSSESGPAAISFPVLSTISYAAPSTLAPAAASLSAPAAAFSAAVSMTPTVTSSSTTVIPVATSPKSGPDTSTTRTGISVFTITENETRTFFGTKSRNGSHINPPFTSPCGSKPTTLQTSTKINGTSISSTSGPHRTGGPCLKDSDRWCPSPNINNTQASDNGSGINQPPSNDFRVDITVNGGNFRGGKPFNSSGTYHGNCTNGILDAGMASTDVHEPCGRDLMCLAGVLMASLGSVVTEIMNPTPKGTVFIWCSNGMGGTNSSTKMSGSGSGVPWSASETGKWNTSKASETMIETPGALSNTQIQPTHTAGVPESLSTTLEPLPSSRSPRVISSAIPTDTRSMFKDNAHPTLNQRAVPTKTESVNSGYMPSVTQRQLITTTVSDSYTTATYDCWKLSPFTWSVNSVQVSEALTMLSTGTPAPTNTA